MTTVTETFGGWLRQARQAKGLTQAELAGLLKVSVTTVARWERGEVRPTPLAEQAVRLTVVMLPKGRRD